MIVGYRQVELPSDDKGRKALVHLHRGESCLVMLATEPGVRRMGSIPQWVGENSFNLVRLNDPPQEVFYRDLRELSLGILD